jgi:hypothetical protein
MTADAMYVAPRDVLHPPTESDELYVVTLTCPAHAATPLHLIFAMPLTEGRAPTMRDVLWWLASDAWAIETAHRGLAAWAAQHDYAVDAPATARLFARHVQQATDLAALLGPMAYRRLLALFEAEAFLGRRDQANGERSDPLHPV